MEGRTIVRPDVDADLLAGAPWTIPSMEGRTIVRPDQPSTH